MRFLSEFLRGLREGNGEQAARSRDLVPVRQAKQLVERPEVLPPAQRARQSRPVSRQPAEVDDEWEVVAPGAPLFRFEVWCSATGRPFLAVAERHGETLYIVGNEKPGTELAASGWPEGYNHYAIDAAPEWCCPWCGVREDAAHDFLRLIWSCQNPGCGEPLHCCGSTSRGMFKCACGGLSRRKFYRENVFPVYEFHGLRGASARGLPASTYGPGGDVMLRRYPAKSTGSLLVRSTWLVPRRRG